MNNMNMKQHWCKTITFTFPNKAEQPSKNNLENKQSSIKNKPKKVTQPCTT